MAKTLTLRLSENDQILIEALKKMTGESTASKAIMYAIKQYGIHLRTINALNEAVQTERQREYVKLWED